MPYLLSFFFVPGKLPLFTNTRNYGVNRSTLQEPAIDDNLYCHNINYTHFGCVRFEEWGDPSSSHFFYQTRMRTVYLCIKTKIVQLQ
jgi:hypothetical protein